MLLLQAKDHSSPFLALVPDLSLRSSSFKGFLVKSMGSHPSARACTVIMIELTVPLKLYKPDPIFLNDAQYNCVPSFTCQTHLSEKIEVSCDC